MISFFVRVVIESQYLFNKYHVWSIPSALKNCLHQHLAILAIQSGCMGCSTPWRAWCRDGDHVWCPCGQWKSQACVKNIGQNNPILLVIKRSCMQKLSTRDETSLVGDCKRDGCWQTMFNTYKLTLDLTVLADDTTGCFPTPKTSCKQLSHSKWLILVR